MCIRDRKDVHDAEYARQLLLSMRFELQSYLNYFNILIGKKSNEIPVLGKRDSRAMNPFYIEPKSHKDHIMKRYDVSFMNPADSLDRSMDLSGNNPIETAEIYQEKIKTIDQILDRESLKSAKWFLIEIQRAKYLLPFSDPKEFTMKDPFVEVEVYLRKKQENRKATPEYVTISKSTAKYQNPITPSWLEFIRFDMKSILDSPNMVDVEEGYFVIRLMYCDRKNSKKTIQIGEEQRFSFKEIIDQRVYDKTLTLKNLDKREIYAQMTFRCQVVHDYHLLCQRMRDDIETRMDVIRLTLEELKLRNGRNKYGASSVSFTSNNPLDVPLRGHEASSIPHKYQFTNQTNESMYESKFYVN
eukprot:TRINITY_DN3247_c0_g1_i2.p1 TRINITY_DN3247_c0_g1~~TRINITY_DN3247_c0_g1_i2.p1  ORF type:complete len:357 (+),score=58.81 TRINITY_DN3247_c0_g1_i2:65-1135(+)